MARERLRVADTVAAMPNIHDGVTQTDIEGYGVACYEAGRKQGRREHRDEMKAKRESSAELIRQTLELADALRDGGVDDTLIEQTTIRVMLGKT